MTTKPRTEAQEFWDTHCVDCAHDMHPMNVCSAIVGGDHNGPNYCPCAIDYPMLAAAYQARAEAARLALEDVAERVRALPTFDDGAISRSTDVVLPCVDRAAVLALLSTKEDES